MRTTSQVAEQHIREHLSRQQQRDALTAADLEQRKCCIACKPGDPPGTCRPLSLDGSGPLCICDALAQSLESFVELFDQAPRCDLSVQTQRRGRVHIT